MKPQQVCRNQNHKHALNVQIVDSNPEQMYIYDFIWQFGGCYLRSLIVYAFCSTKASLCVDIVTENSWYISLAQFSEGDKFIEMLT